MNQKAVAYLRTSSLTNIGEDKDSDDRQRHYIKTYADNNHITIVDEFYDKAVKGSDPVDTRPGFAQMLDYINTHDVRIILVESASRFARDLMVQETGYAYLKKQNITLICVDDPDNFILDTPTAIMVRQILGAVAQFEKASLVAKMKRARDKASEKKGSRVEGRTGYKAAEYHELVTKVKELHQEYTLEGISRVLFKQGITTKTGKPLHFTQIKRMLSFSF
jgi:DNA invertase Pin-like site-specific DNA recombinase